MAKFHKPLYSIDEPNMAVKWDEERNAIVY